MYEQISNSLPKTVERDILFSVAGQLLRTGTLPADYDTISVPLPDVSKMHTKKHRDMFKHAVIDAFNWHEFGAIPQIVARTESDPSPYTRVFKLHQNGYDIGHVDPYSMGYHNTPLQVSTTPAVQGIAEKHTCLYVGESTLGKGVRLVVQGSSWPEMEACIDELIRRRPQIEHLFVVYNDDEVPRENVLRAIKPLENRATAMPIKEWKIFPYWETLE